MLHHCYRKCCMAVTENDALQFTENAVFSVTVSREWLEDVLKKIPYYLRDGQDMTRLLPRTWANSASTRD